jgi:hypothetical protein
MNEGWFNDDYLVLFSDAEVEDATIRYGIESSVPGYVVLGLRGWDDLIVRDPLGGTHTIPAVPLDRQYLQEYRLPISPAFAADARFKNKIKWYLKPLVFGGNPDEKDNLTWITHEQHAQLVVWWNNQYRAIKAQNA